LQDVELSIFNDVAGSLGTRMEVLIRHLVLAELLVEHIRVRLDLRDLVLDLDGVLLDLVFGAALRRAGEQQRGVLVFLNGLQPLLVAPCLFDFKLSIGC